MVTMNFASDNWTGASDRVAAALVGAAGGHAPAYGSDPQTLAVTQALSRLFEREVAVYFVATGTAANALALAQLSRPSGVVFCHVGAHIRVDEAGAPEFLSGGRLHGIQGDSGRIVPADLAKALSIYPASAVFHGQPMAVSVSQLTEAGTAYSAAEISAIAKVAHDAGLPLHMDGARFANAVAGLGVHPADITWRAGVDILSFGGSKNGCFAAEAVVFFNPEQAKGFEFHRKRAGHLFSKSRFMAAQFEAYLADDHWLELARHANAMATRLADGITRSPGGRLAVQPDGNQVFAMLPRAVDARLRSHGAIYYEWPGDLGAEPAAPDEVVVRLVTSFRTETAEVDRFVGLLTQ
jgi:threonine aldolase